MPFYTWLSISLSDIVMALFVVCQNNICTPNPTYMTKTSHGIDSIKVIHETDCACIPQST